jgi:dTDP-4-amino-4,6-dideoxygalactose transaminase
MNRADKILRERQDIAFRYDEVFTSHEGIGNPIVKEENFVHGYQSYACIYKPNDVKKALQRKDYDSLINISEKRNEFMDILAAAGVGSRPPTHAIHTLSYYKEKYQIKETDFPNAWAANICGFSIPIFPGLTVDDQEYVIQSILKF